MPATKIKPIRQSKATRHDNHTQNAGCNLIKNVHRVVLEKVQIRCNSRRNVSDTVIMEKAHRHIPQPVAQCNPFSGYKLKACRTLQPVNQIFENHAQD